MNNNDLRQRVSADLVSQLPRGTFNLSTDQLATVLSCSSGHIRNQLSQKTFPIRSVAIGSRRVFPLTLVVDYLVSLVETSSKPSRGRPRKSAKKAAMQMQGGAA